VLAELELYGGEEALHHRLVVAVAATAHAHLMPLIEDQAHGARLERHRIRLRTDVYEIGSSSEGIAKPLRLAKTPHR
jgi:hypothetical protein